MNTKNAYMIFRGVHSADLGVCLRAAPTIGSTVRRTSAQTEIPGVDGKSYTYDGGYAAITITVKLACTVYSDLSRIRRWLMDSGDLVFGDAPDRCYKNAAITKDIKYQPAGTGRTGRIEFDVTFTADPFQQQYGGGYMTMHDGMQIVNPGDFTAMPLMRITAERSGDVRFVRDGVTQTIGVTGATEDLYIDCTTGYAFTAAADVDPFAYRDALIRPEMVRGDLIRLEPGAYEVEVDPQIVSAIMLPRWRWA